MRFSTFALASICLVAFAAYQAEAQTTAAATTPPTSVCFGVKTVSDPNRCKAPANVGCLTTQQTGSSAVCCCFPPNCPDGKVFNSYQAAGGTYANTCDLSKGCSYYQGNCCCPPASPPPPATTSG